MKSIHTSCFILALVFSDLPIAYSGECDLRLTVEKIGNVNWLVETPSGGSGSNIGNPCEMNLFLDPRIEVETQGFAYYLENHTTDNDSFEYSFSLAVPTLLEFVNTNQSVHFFQVISMKSDLFEENLLSVGISKIPRALNNEQTQWELILQWENDLIPQKVLLNNRRSAIDILFSWSLQMDGTAIAFLETNGIQYYHHQLSTGFPDQTKLGYIYAQGDLQMGNLMEFGVTNRN